VTCVLNRIFPKFHLKRNTRSFVASFITRTADETVVLVGELQHYPLMQGNTCLMMCKVVKMIEIESTVTNKKKITKNYQSNEAELHLPRTKQCKSSKSTGLPGNAASCHEQCNTHDTLSSAILSCGSSPASHLAIELYLIKSYKNTAREAQHAPHKFSDPFKTSANQRRNASGGSKSKDFVTCRRNQAARHFLSCSLRLNSIIDKIDYVDVA
jgi:hypothetical protein